MGKLVKDFIEIKDLSSLDALIERLIEVRDSLPEVAAPQVRLRGDDVFGRLLSISYHRPQTSEEMERDARYAHAYRESCEREMSRLQNELGVCPLPNNRRRRLRIVA